MESSFFVCAIPEMFVRLSCVIVGAFCNFPTICLRFSRLDTASQDIPPQTLCVARLVTLWLLLLAAAAEAVAMKWPKFMAAFNVACHHCHDASTAWATVTATLAAKYIGSFADG